MGTKKETAIDYFVAIPAFLSMLVMLNYYFSFFVISRILRSYDIDTYSILSIEDVLFPMASINKAAFMSIFLLIVSLLVLSYFINQVYDRKKEKIKDILGKYVNLFTLKSWCLISIIFLLVIGALFFLFQGIFLIILVLAVLIFKFSNIFSLRNCVILFGIFVCSLHLFYDFILRTNIQKENKDSSEVIIEMHDNDVLNVGRDSQIVFWGAKYVILKKSKSNQVELIPTSEIKHIMIRNIE